MKRTRWLLLLLLSIPGTLAAQGVLIAPTSIFIDSRARTATILLVNPNDEAVEVTLGTTYGYAITDSLGRFEPWFTDTPDSTAPSAASWIRVFPRRASVAPGAQQVVRLLVSPPADLPDGEYWARLTVMARGGTLQVPQSTDSSSVTIGLPMQVRTILPILYRKGQVTAGASLDSLRANRDGDSLVVRARIARGGGAAVLGTVQGTLEDSTGAVRRSFVLPVSVYAPIDPRFAVATDSLPPGRYLLRVAVLPGRADLPPDVQLSFRAARDSLAVELP